jgi:hypothetical protein
VCFSSHPVSQKKNSKLHSMNLQSSKTELIGLSPRANYTDRATAACRRCYCQLFADRRCCVVRATDPHGRILGFLYQSSLLRNGCVLKINVSDLFQICVKFLISLLNKLKSRRLSCVETQSRNFMDKGCL